MVVMASDGPSLHSPSLRLGPIYISDASVMRIILMVNAIADGPYSMESSKRRNFSLRAAFTAEKVRLDE